MDEKERARERFNEARAIIRDIAKAMRTTAEELKAGTIHPHHAANRLLKHANRLAPKENES